tara:strand:+ start:64 stop:405 length:342 start_codon:yes stop_codon:yes gene_type:complete
MPHKKGHVSDADTPFRNKDIKAIGNGFRKSFSSARQANKKTFDYKGKSYTTKTAEDVAKKQTVKQNIASSWKAQKEAGKRQYDSKSHNEIFMSFQNAYGKHQKNWNYKKPKQP